MSELAQDRALPPAQVNGQRVNILVVLSIQLVQEGSTRTKESELEAERVSLQVQDNGHQDSTLEECLSIPEDRVLLVGIFQEQLVDNTQEQLEDSIQQPQEDNIQEQPVDNIQERPEDSIQGRLEDSIQEQLEDNSLVEHIQELLDNFQEVPRLVERPDIITLAPAQDSIQRERDNIQEQVEYLVLEQVNTTLEEREVQAPVRELACRVPVVSVNTEANYRLELD